MKIIYTSEVKWDQDVRKINLKQYSYVTTFQITQHHWPHNNTYLRKVKRNVFVSSKITDLLKSVRKQSIYESFQR